MNLGRHVQASSLPVRAASLPPKRSAGRMPAEPAAKMAALRAHGSWEGRPGGSVHAEGGVGNDLSSGEVPPRFLSVAVSTQIAENHPMWSWKLRCAAVRAAAAICCASSAMAQSNGILREVYYNIS